MRVAGRIGVRIADSETRPAMLFNIVIAAAAGFVALVYMVMSAIGPAMFFSLTSPFDALFNGLFGFYGNAVTYLPLLAILVSTSPTAWIDQFFGSRIQRFVFLFIIALSISHVVTFSIYPEAAVTEYLRKLTLFMVVGIWASGMRSADQLSKLNRVLVLSTAAYTLISMTDFYFGVGALPGADASASGVLGETLADTSNEHTLRYRGGGLPINRTANWLIVPTFLGFGWFMLVEKGRSKMLGLACAIICITGIFATVGRSAIVATIVGFLVIIFSRGGLQPKKIVGTTVVVSAMGVIGLLFMWQIGFLDLFEARFVGEGSEDAAVGRLQLYFSALQIWMTSPVIGVGDAAMPAHPLYVGSTAHNSFLGILAEAGLVGFIPYLALTVMFVLRFVRKSKYVDPAFDAWRPYFFAGFVASMTQNMFNEYTWERFIWYTVCYLIAYERLDAMGRAAAAREAMEQAPGFDSSFGNAPSGAQTY
jgi:hypothetical protein